MAALCEMKLNLHLAKHDGIWLPESPEAEIALAYEENEDDEGRRSCSQRWTRPASHGQDGAELLVRGSSEREELLGQAKPQNHDPGLLCFGTGNPPVWNRCTRASGSRPLRATGPKRSDSSGTVSAAGTKSKEVHRGFAVV